MLQNTLSSATLKATQTDEKYNKLLNAQQEILVHMRKILVIGLIVLVFLITIIIVKFFSITSQSEPQRDADDIQSQHAN